MVTEKKIDWSACPLVEAKAEVHSGDPVVRGTRMPVDAVVSNSDYGVGTVEIAEQFELPVASIEAILMYARAWREAHR